MPAINAIDSFFTLFKRKIYQNVWMACKEDLLFTVGP
jgi:hypothetical protein